MVGTEQDVKSGGTAVLDSPQDVQDQKTLDSITDKVAESIVGGIPQETQELALLEVDLISSDSALVTVAGRQVDARLVKWAKSHFTETGIVGLSEDMATEDLLGLCAISDGLSSAGESGSRDLWYMLSLKGVSSEDIAASTKGRHSKNTIENGIRFAERFPAGSPWRLSAPVTLSHNIAASEKVLDVADGERRKPEHYRVAKIAQDYLAGFANGEVYKETTFRINEFGKEVSAKPGDSGAASRLVPFTLPTVDKYRAILTALAKANQKVNESSVCREIPNIAWQVVSVCIIRESYPKDTATKCIPGMPAAVKKLTKAQAQILQTIVDECLGKIIPAEQSVKANLDGLRETMENAQETLEELSVTGTAEEINAAQAAFETASAAFEKARKDSGGNDPQLPVAPPEDIVNAAATLTKDDNPSGKHNTAELTSLIIGPADTAKWAQYYPDSFNADTAIHKLHEAYFAFRDSHKIAKDKNARVNAARDFCNRVLAIDAK